MRGRVFGNYWVFSGLSLDTFRVEVGGRVVFLWFKFWSLLLFWLSGVCLLFGLFRVYERVDLRDGI